MKTISTRLSLCSLFLLLGSSMTNTLGGLDLPPGDLYTQNFSLFEEFGGRQIFDLVQDKRGFIYSASASGVGIFDGARWTSCPIPKGGAFSFYYDPDTDRLYVGSIGNMGYIKDLETGNPTYVSFLDDLGLVSENVGRIWQIGPWQGNILFRSDKGFFVLKGDDQMTYIDAGERLHRMVRIDGKVYVQGTVGGLLEIADGALKASEIAVHEPGDFYYFLTRIEDRTIAFTRSGRAYDLGPETVQRDFPRIAALHAQVYNGTTLRNGTIVLTTLDQGIVLMDPNGGIIKKLSKENGLPSNTIICAMEDMSGGLWLGTQEGIARVEVHHPLTRLTDTHGLEGQVQAVSKLKNQLFIGTHLGLKVADLEKTPLQFNQVGPAAPIWGFLPIGEDMIVAQSESLMVLHEGRFEPEYLDSEAYCLTGSPRGGNWVFVGSENRLFVYRFENHQLERIHVIPIQGQARRLMADSRGGLWAGTLFKGLNYMPDPINRPDLVHHLLAEDGTMVHPIEADGEILIGTQKGSFVVTDWGDAEKPPTLKKESVIEGLDKDISAEYKTIDDKGRLWIRIGNDMRSAEKDATGRYRLIEDLLRRADTYILDAFDPGTGILWFASLEGLVCLKETYAFHGQGRNVYIRSIIDMSREESLPNRIDQLTPDQQHLRFNFSTPDFDAYYKNQYRVRMDRIQSDWSNWQNEPYKEFTNLPWGKHTLRVQAKNAYGSLSEEGVLTFNIQPPFYLSQWAFLFYFLLSMVLLWLFVQIWGLRLRRANQRLAKTVALRTQEVEQQKQQLEDQNRELESQNRALSRQKEKIAQQAAAIEAETQQRTRLFADLSHELRTPLTLTLSPLEDLLADPGLVLPERVNKELKRTMHHGRGLLNLLQQMMSLAKQEYSQERVEKKTGDLAAFLRVVVYSFESFAESRKTRLRFQDESRLSRCAFDEERLKPIFNNLLINAFQALGQGGEVLVTLRDDAHTLVVSVQDTGPGIPKAEQALLFDRYYQGDRQTGVGGLGLSMAKRLAERHGGSLEVESTPGEGTTFIVSLPRGEIGQDLSQPKPNDPNPKSYESESTAPSQETKPGDTLILVVEDHPELRTYIAEQLDSDYQILQAADGIEGLELAREQQPDLIISDVMMPRMSGFELCEAVKADPQTSHIPVVMLTARADSEDRVKGRGLGADDYLVKPFNSRELKLLVDNRLKLLHQIRERYSRQTSLTPPLADLTSVDRKFMSEVERVVSESLGEAGFGVAELADRVALSSRQLNRKISAITGQSPVVWIRKARLERAAQLLKAKTGNISEIAYDVGFESPAYFSKQFREHFGVSPSAYAKDSDQGT